MTTLSRAPGSIASVELGAALARALRNRLGATTGIARIERRDFPSATSYPIEEFAVVLKSGGEVTLLLKNLAVGAMLPGARAAKPELVQDPRREIHVYRSILDGAGLGTAECYLAHADEERGRYWLALERVAGVELFQVGDLEVWKDVARWLAAAHSRLARHARPGADRSPLLDYGEAFYRSWALRAYDFASDRDRLLLAPVVERYDRVVERLVALPRTLIHG